MTLTKPEATAFIYRDVALHDRLREVAREVGTKPALVHGERVVSYAELDAASDRLAAALARRGVVRGDRVTILTASGKILRRELAEKQKAATTAR